MSKAFTKEDDDAPPPVFKARGVPVPADGPNYITAAGIARLRDELARLDPASDRAVEVAAHLESAQVIEPGDCERVGFGCTVTVEDGDGNRKCYQIVGAIEAEPAKGAIYWQSPVAHALFDAQVGDTVELPRGEVEVVAIAM